MSAAEIIKELPKLTEAERREVARKLAELNADDDVEFSNQAALQSFQELDRQEDEARRVRLKAFFAEWDATHSVTVGEKPTRALTYADNSRLR
jgi:hypothetical protein